MKMVISKLVISIERLFYQLIIARIAGCLWRVQNPVKYEIWSPFVNTVNSTKPLNIFTKGFIIDIC